MLGAVDREGRRAQYPQLADDRADAGAGTVLGFAGDGEGGEHDGEVGFDRVAGAVEHGAGREVGFAFAVQSCCKPRSRTHQHHKVGTGRFGDACRTHLVLSIGRLFANIWPGCRRRVDIVDRD